VYAPSLKDKVVLITGAARRVGRALAISAAQAGADVIVHYHRSRELAEGARREIEEVGCRAWILEADLSRPKEAADLVQRAFELAPVFGLVNNAAIFEGGQLSETELADWDRHMAINLTAPFLLARDFARLLGKDGQGRVVNVLDWRALRPGPDHFAYTVSKAALAAMTRSLAQAMAPHVSVNGLALGAFLPPQDGPRDPLIVSRVPAGRWGELHEAGSALVFLLGGPAYVTGEIIYVDGGRHLV
jgi:pteridine reductase